MVDGVRFRARPWCGTGERPGARLGVGVEGRSVRQAPAVAVAGGAAVLFPFEQGIAETDIVDAQPLRQGGCGQRPHAQRRAPPRRAAAARRGGRRGAGQAAGGRRHAGAAGRVWRGGAAMLDGEQQAPVAAVRQIAGGIGPGLQIRCTGTVGRPLTVG